MGIRRFCFQRNRTQHDSELRVLFRSFEVLLVIDFNDTTIITTIRLIQLIDYFSRIHIYLLVVIVGWNEGRAILSNLGVRFTKPKK